jgi:uncharacterized protein (TIGR00725 family)
MHMASPAKATIGVMGSGSDEFDAVAKPLGQLLGRLHVNLLTGAGGGVMTSVSRAYTEVPRERGICIGIVPCADINNRAKARDKYPNRFVELPIFTHLPYSGEQGQHDLSRNHINILSSTAIVALPGGTGTASEVALAVKYQKPIIAFSPSEALVSSFHPTVRRTRQISDVEAFQNGVLSTIG